jgi:hypothetical protein
MRKTEGEKNGGSGRELRVWPTTLHAEKLEKVLLPSYCSRPRPRPLPLSIPLLPYTKPPTPLGLSLHFTSDSSTSTRFCVIFLNFYKYPFPPLVFYDRSILRLNWSL